MGDATPAALSHAMGNTLSASNALFATYVPVNVASLRAVMEARRRGRRSSVENISCAKVGMRRAGKLEWPEADLSQIAINLGKSNQ